MGSSFVLQGICPRTFEELSYQGHDMALSISNPVIKIYTEKEIMDQLKENKEWKRNDKSGRSQLKRAYDRQSCFNNLSTKIKRRAKEISVTSK